ncbi:MAG: DUF2207 domain-containing protein [Candidatus Anstonellales archaeon]
MKLLNYKNLRHFVFGFLIIFLSTSWVAFAANEVIESFNVQIDLHPDSSVEVTEFINYNFGSNQKHGILRNIPLTSENGPNLDINVLKVTDPNNKDYPYTTSMSNNVLTIKIGDPNVLVSGKKTYVIKYTVLNAIRNFSDHQELYWNVTGNDWNVSIGNSEVDILLFRSLSSPKIICYTGPYGSREQNCTYSFNDTSVKYILTKSLGPKEGFTIVLGFPNNYFQIANTNNTNSVTSITSPSETSFKTKSLHFIKNTTDYLRVFGGAGILIFILILIAFFILQIIKFVFKILAKAKITDDIFSPYHKPRPYIPRSLRGHPIIAEYEPPQGLSPIDVGTILDQKVDPTDLSSVIIHLAIRGYLKIKYLETPILFNTKIKDFEFIKLKDGTDLTHPVDKWIFFLFFNNQNQVKLSNLIGPASSFMPQVLLKIKEDEKKYLINQGYIVSSEQKIKHFGIFPAIIKGALIITLFIALITINYWARLIPAMWLVVLYFSWIFYNVFTTIKKTRFQLTPQGLTTLSKILGFKEFLAVTETDRIKFFNAPELKPEKFEEYLPYAMVLGVENEWAQKFVKIYTTSPTWYEHPDMNLTAFNSYLLSQNLILLTGSLNTAFNISTASGSSGGYSSGFSGGSSGGGSGGGGGSSW